jgi:hypothetical protein
MCRPLTFGGEIGRDEISNPGLPDLHEAAVGKIAPEEIEYLMARGLAQEEATAAIVRGFLDIEIRGLPESIREEISKALRIEEIL